MPYRQQMLNNKLSAKKWNDFTREREWADSENQLYRKTNKNIKVTNFFGCNELL